MASAVRTCETCGKDLPPSNEPAPDGRHKGGRPPRYCSGACRQRAFRQRAAARARTATAGNPVTARAPANTATAAAASTIVTVAVGQSRGHRHHPERLPQPLDPFVGRVQELARLRSAVRASRLVTLVGPGGAGKTRLALELARHSRDRQPALVELDTVRQAEQLPQVIAAALGVAATGGRRVLDALVDAVGGTPLLVVLDNCEHLIDACAEVVDALLRRCAGLRIVATSRETLRVPGELVFRVGELSLPAAGAAHPAVRRSEAVQLFVDRARAREPGFELTPDNAIAVAEICRRVDGLPLAIELAARRSAALPVSHILAGLDDQLALLTDGSRTAPTRHRELGAAIEWSYRLLDPTEQALLRRLSVLVGGFDINGATAVGAGGDIEPDAVLRLLCALEAKSLISCVSGDAKTARFRQLSAIRSYAHERLAASGELAATRERAVAWLAELAAPLAGPLFQDVRALGLHTEHENLAAAAEYSSGDRHVLITVALARVWLQQDQVTPLRALMTAALERVPESRYRSDALALAARAACIQADHDDGLRLAEEAVAIERGRDRPAGLANALNALAFTLLCSNDSSRAIDSFRECLEVLRPLGRPVTIALSQHHLAWALAQVGDVAAAEDLMTECVPVLRALSTRQHQAAALHTAGTIQLKKHDVRAAEAAFVEVLDIVAPTTSHAAYAVEGLGLVAAERGDGRRALRLIGAAAGIRADLGVESEATWRRQVEEAAAGVQRQLRSSAVDASLAAGRRLRGDRLLTYARPDGADNPGHRHPLTTREVQVARLVADGLTNRQIAARLELSVGTVATHLDSIRDKLGVRTRTQIAMVLSRPAATGS